MKAFSRVAAHCIADFSFTGDQEDKTKIWEKFKGWLPDPEKTGKNGNPLFSKNHKKSAVEQFNFRTLLCLLKEKKADEAYNNLKKITGVGHKIASFFLRDIMSIFEIDISDWKPEQLCFLQPIDVWLEKIFNILILPISNEEPKKDIKDKLGGEAYPKYRWNICQVCWTNKINSLYFNYGAWFFGSQIAGSDKLLNELLEDDCHPRKMIEYTQHLEPYLPFNWVGFKDELNKKGLNELLSGNKTTEEV